MQKQKNMLKNQVLCINFQIPKTLRSNFCSELVFRTKRQQIKEVD